MHSEETICLLLNKRDPKGLEGLFDMYYQSLVLWADTFTNNIQQAEDVVQELFIKIWERELYKKFEVGKIKTYLFTAVRRLALNRIEKKDPLRQAYDVKDYIMIGEESDQKLEQLLEMLEKEVEKLPERSREVVEAVYFKGMRYKEVAEHFDISISTVKTLLVNSLRRLREDSKNFTAILFLFFQKKVRFLFNRF